MSGEAQLEALLDIINASARKAFAEYKKGGNDVPTIHSNTFHPVDFATNAVALKKAVKLLEGACQQLCASLVPPQYTVGNFSIPYEWACMQVVVRAKIADVLEKYPNGLHVDELAKFVNLERGKLARVLRLLTSKGCFTEVKPNIFANNRVSLVTLSKSNSGACSRMWAEDVSQAAVVLYEAMTEPGYATSHHPGRSPLIYALEKKGFKGNYFDLLQEDAERRENFHRAMIGFSISSLSVLHYYPWNEVRTVCDVGSGVGAISRPLLKMHPHLKITLQDLPEVVVQAKDVWAKDAPDAVNNNQVKFVALNFIEESPVQGQDVYYLHNVIHDWPDAEAAIILANIRKAMVPHSRLLIHGTVLPASRGNSNTKLFELNETSDPLLPSFANRGYCRDLLMFFVHNAKERTLDELMALGSAAGLRLDKVFDLAESAVLEFRLATWFSI